MQTCGSFKSANPKKTESTNSKSSKCHICGRSSNLTNYLSPHVAGLGLRNLFADRPPFLNCHSLKTVYGSRCTQLPLIEKLLQWLSGPSSSLSVATDRPRDTGPDSNDVRTRSIYSTNSVDDINAQSG
jgi:hypothetical protein